jgi:hypothetical protein
MSTSTVPLVVRKVRRVLDQELFVAFATKSRFGVGVAVVEHHEVLGHEFVDQRDRTVLLRATCSADTLLEIPANK